MTQDRVHLDRAVRSGAIWTWHEDYLPLWESLDFNDAEIGDLLGRSVKAVKSRARDVAQQLGDTVRPGIDGLRDVHPTCGLDEYRDAVTRMHAAGGLPLWDREADELLHAAWNVGSPSLPALADRLEVTEQLVVARLFWLGLITSTSQAVARLGCTPGGVLHVRSLLAMDKTASAVWVLAVTSADGTTVTTHSTRRHAEDTLTEAQAHAPDTDSVQWTITENVVGEPFSRTHDHGSFTPHDASTPSGSAARTPAPAHPGSPTVGPSKWLMWTRRFARDHSPE